MNCRHCGAPLELPFLDLGYAPPTNAYQSAKDLNAPELTYPLRIKACTECWLVQTEDFARAEDLFTADYAYFSSTSSTWVSHAARYAEAITRQLNLSSDSLVIEVASNDGYLLKNFVAAGVPCLGIEPTADTADAAEAQGVPVLREFFGEAIGRQLAEEGRQADLLVGNNVYGHVPDINDFTRGFTAALKPGGTVTLEFPHVMRLIEHTQFDTVYHEHFSYLSLYTVDRIFDRAGLRLFDVEELRTHGGSVRVFGCHTDDPRSRTDRLAACLEEEERNGLRTREVYEAFQARADAVKDGLLVFLLAKKRDGKHVAAYGAAAKGNTLLNYAGIKPDLLPYVCDAAPSKQGKYLPGSHIPVLPPEALKERRPDVVLIMPWNIADEVAHQHAYVRDWGGRFAVAVPEIRILE